MGEHAIRDLRHAAEAAAGAAAQAGERERELLVEHNKALESIARGRPSHECLEALTDTVSRLQPEARACVLLADAEGKAFEQVIAHRMPASFGLGIVGAPINEQAIGTCGTALYIGEPVTCGDIAASEHWSAPWRALCLAHGVHACHSAPVFAADGRPVASFFLCFGRPGQPDAWDLRLADFGAQVAGIAIERDRATQALRESEARLAAELADSRLLHDIGAQLMLEDDEAVLYEKILDAAIAIMRSQCASLQMLHPRRGAAGELELLASRGLGAEAGLWQRVQADSAGSCGRALRAGRRVVVPAVEQCDALAGSEDMAAFARIGIQAIQSTPLVSCKGSTVGMLSTHWHRPHQPTERDLRLLDMVARQAADLIERRHAAALQRADAARLRIALAAGRFGEFDLELASGAMECSAQCKANFGLAADQPLPYARLFELIHADDRERVRRTVRRAIETRSEYESEYRTVWPGDGSVHWVAARGGASYGTDGTPLRMTGVTHDITDRKAAQQALQASETRYRAQVADLTVLHEQMTQLTGDRELEPVLSEVLHSALALTGTVQGMLTLADAGRDDLALVASAGFRPAYLRLVARVPKGAGACGTCYLRRERVVVEDTDSDPIFAPYREAARVGGYRSAHATPLIAADGSVLGVLTLFAPQPGRPGEREVRLADLLARHAAGHVERLRLVQALRDADRHKDEFLATLAHELRNPLAPIRNSLHLLGLAHPGTGTERVREMLERQVNHMVRLVDDLMEVSRISRGSIELRRGPLELADVLRTAVETSRPLLEQDGHRFSLVLPDEPLPVDGDAVRLAQVFANLLNNAARYTDAGGRIELTAAREGGASVRVSVRDSGIGLTSEQLPQLFHMFAQVDRGARRSQGGLGIGLSLVQRLVQMHGGSVEARSEGLGRGSEFSVRLPLARPAAAAADARPAVAATALPMRRMLVVDDNRDAADSLGLLLGFLGGEVRVEHDGPSALATLEGWQPQVVLLDLGMPGMDGYEVARRVRAEPRYRGLTLIALTGWGQEEDRRRTRAEGFDHHLVKPVDLGVLQALISTLDGGDRGPLSPGPNGS